MAAPYVAYYRGTNYTNAGLVDYYRQIELVNDNAKITKVFGVDAFSGALNSVEMVYDDGKNPYQVFLSVNYFTTEFKQAEFNVPSHVECKEFSPFSLTNGQISFNSKKPTYPLMYPFKTVI